jgi:hypothetical protein
MTEASVRRDPWHCGRCGRPADLAPLALEVGLVRLALDSAPERFRLGSAGIEEPLAALLAPCACGGALEPGDGLGEPLEPRIDEARLRPLAERGWAALEAVGGEGRLAELRRLWRPRALLLLGRGGELAREEQLRLKLEGRLAGLHAEMEAARGRGDEDAAEAAHARYIELGTIYVRRFLLADEPAARAQ